MSKTRAGYGSGIARPKIDDKDHFELKGQFLKELRDNTFSGSDHEDANEHIEKVLEIIDLFHYCPSARTAKKMEEINNFQQEPDKTLYQAWERFKELLMKFPQHYLKKMQEIVADAKVAIQEMAEYSQKWHNRTSRTRSTETSDGLAAIQAQLNNLGREIKKVNEKVYAAQGGQYRAAALGFYQRNNMNPSRLDNYYYDEKKGSYGLQCLDAHSYGATRVNDSLPRKEKDPGSFTLTCCINNVCFENALADLGASVSVMPLSTYLNLVVENMDGYRDQDMGDVIFGEPFYKASCMEARRFDGLITIHNGNDNVTYQNLASVPKSQKILQGGLELRTRIYSRCEDGRMALTRAHKRA
ncbi:hypothetical protein Tco_0604004 [Tanacetum coccineum]